METLDYRFYTIMNLPILLRTDDRIDWLYLQTKPLETIDSNVDVDWEYNYFEVSHNSQVMVFEHYLNNRVNPTVPITITDGDIEDQIYIFRDDAINGFETYLFNDSEMPTVENYIYTDVELDEQNIDYYVNLANADSALETTLISYVNRLAPAGKKYEINIY